jgi:hypothetical protein
MVIFKTIRVPLYLCEAVQLLLTVVYKSEYNYDVDEIYMIDDDGRHNIPKAAYDLMIIGSTVDVEEKIQNAIAEREKLMAA